MVFASTRNSRRRASNQRRLAAAGGLFCIALIVVAMVLHPREPKEESLEAQSGGATQAKAKPQSPWNLALGNVVAVAPDLGLTAKTPTGGQLDSSRLAAIVESQLASLREIYRAESEKQPALMGSLMLEIIVGENGQVTQARELKSRLANPEFRKLVLAEAKNWNFKDAVPGGATIQCPLLFVREGMEIATLTKWEKSLGFFAEKAPVPAAPPKPLPEPATN